MVIFSLASMNRFHVQSMANDKVYTYFFTEVCHPVPAMHALNTNYNLSNVRFQKLIEEFGVSRNFLMKADFTLLIDNADLQYSGM